MKAELMPLHGKYYETVIRLDNGVTISLCGGGPRPSDREITGCGFSVDDWDKNIAIDDGWGNGGTVPIQHPDAGIVDPGGHYERQEAYEAAILIVNSINGEG